MLALVVMLKPKRGRNADLEEAFRWATASVRSNEPGNLLYQVVKSRADDQTYLILELYKDNDALMAHRYSEHALAMREKIEGVLTEEPHIEYYDGI